MMTEPRAKVLDYSIELDRRYRISADGGDPQQLPRDFAPEHLALAGLARCTLASLAYHAHRAGMCARLYSAARRGLVAISTPSPTSSDRCTSRCSTPSAPSSTTRG